MSTIKISELATSAISLTDFFAKADASGLANKNTVQGLSNFLNTVGTLAYRGVLLAADAAVTEDGIYVAGDAGTYTNNGGLVITVSNQIVLISITGSQTVFKKVEIPVTITIDATPTEGSTNVPASGGVYDYTKNNNADIFTSIDNNIVNKSINGDSEYVGDGEYSAKGVGMYNLFENDLFFNRFKLKLSVDSPSEVKLRIYKHSSIPSGTFNLTSYNFVQEITYESGVFNSDVNSFQTVDLKGNGISVNAGEVLIVVIKSTSVINSTVKRWLNDSTPAREYVVYNLSNYTSNWDTIWYKGSGGYFSTSFIFEFEKVIAPTGETFVSKDNDSFLSINNKINPLTFYHSRGASEYLGDTTYSYPDGLGLYKSDFLNDTLIKIIKMNFFATSDFSGDIKIYKGTSYDLDMNTHTLIETINRSAGVFNQDSQGQEIIFLENDLIIKKGQFLYVMVEQSTGTLTQKKWTTQSVSPLRNLILLLIGSEWFSATAGNYATPFVLMSDIEGVNSFLENKLKIENRQIKANPRITIPDNIYAVVGIEKNLWHDAIMLGLDRGLQSPANYEVEVICSVGADWSRGFQYTPISSDIGTHDLTVNVYDFNKLLIASKSIMLNVVDNIAPSSVNNLLMIGDSLTSYGDITERIQTNFNSLGSNIPLFHGTQGNGLYKHEGRGGWALSTFTSSNSPFYNNGSLDIANYRSNISLVSLFDIVTIQLGINDVGQTVLKTANDFELYISNYKLLIDAFIADNPNCKIIVGLPSTDSNTKGGYGDNYKATAYKANYQQNIFAFREAMILAFDNANYNANVVIGSVGLECDRYYGYPFSDKQISSAYPTLESVHSNAVHPEISGYRQMGDAFYSQMQNII
tara:strand:- start:643 stop:3228 length:2586 start_codon:yes stop_codon:yes gene_type:complete